MPTINRRNELIIFLQSLESQTYKNFELIVLDQNAGDFITEIIEGFQKHLDIKYIKSSEWGLSLNRNEGLIIADGDIIAFPDDDCEYPEDILEKVVKFFEENKQDLLVIRNIQVAEDKRGQGLGSFFSDISKNGLQQAAKSRGINIEGKTIDEIKELFIDFFLIPAVDSDSVCASKAIETVMENLFNEIANEEELENILSNVIKTEKAKELVCGFYENYIYELFCRIFFEDRTLKTNQSDAEEILGIVKETISSKISGIQCNRNIEGIDFSSQEGSDFVQGILKDILEVLEEE